MGKNCKHTHTHATQTASKLFYVVDNQTRSVASMVEIAFYVGSGRDLVSVVDDITGDSPSIGGERLCCREVQDLNRGREFVRRVMEEADCSLEPSVSQAVSRLIDVSGS